MDLPALLHYLEQLSIEYEYHEHVAVFTSEQARRLIPPLAGASAKNLFLRDRKGHRHFLLSLPDSKTLDLKSLSVSMGLSGSVARFSRAAAEIPWHYPRRGFPDGFGQ